jgi:hypothetical protein
LFYFRGEIDKLGNLLSDKQKSSFGIICNKINDFILFTRGAAENYAYKEIADMLYAINTDMTAEADKLEDYGGAVRFIADEFKGFADSVMRYAE